MRLSGTAQNAPGQTFNATNELQRPGLLLMDGVVYAAFGGHCDITPYQGWVFGVSTAGVVKARWVADQTGNGAGIWQSGAGLTSDGSGNILLSTGNGGAPNSAILGSTPPGNLGESVVRVKVQADGSLRATDFFAPFDAFSLDSWDADFAAGGVTGLPRPAFGTAALPNLAVAVGKQGYVYLLNRDDLGGSRQGPSGSDRVVQRIGPYGGVWARPGIWPGDGGYVYIPTASGGNSAAGSSGNLRVYKYGLDGSGKPALSLQGTLLGRVRLQLQRARHHLRRHDVRLRARVDRLGARVAAAPAHSCAPTTRSRSTACRDCAGARRSASRRSSTRRASAPDASTSARATARCSASARR